VPWLARRQTEAGSWAGKFNTVTRSYRKFPASYQDTAEPYTLQGVIKLVALFTTGMKYLFACVSAHTAD